MALVSMYRLAATGQNFLRREKIQATIDELNRCMRQIELLKKNLETQASGAHAKSTPLALLNLDRNHWVVQGPQARSIGLSKAEWAVMSLLVSQAGIVVTRAEIVAAICNSHDGECSVANTTSGLPGLMMRLRKKGLSHGISIPIISVGKGGGYMFVPESREPPPA